MRATILCGLAIALVSIASGAVAELPKLGKPVPTPAAAKKIAFEARSLTLVQAHKPLTLPQKVGLMMAGRGGPTAQPAPETPFTLSSVSLIRTTNGVPTAGITFTGPDLVSWMHSPSAPPTGYASFSTAAPGGASLWFQIAADKMYLIDCSIFDATTINFYVTTESAVVTSATLIPQANHATYVLPKQGKTQAAYIAIDSGQSPVSEWFLTGCEITPFQ